MSSVFSSELIFVPVLVIVVIACQYILLKNYDYKCGNCGNVFSPSLGSVLLSPHSFGRKRLRCPRCDQVTWAIRVPKGRS